MLMNKAPFLMLTCVALVSGPHAFAQIQLNPSPTRIVGQDNTSQNAANLVEGREFNGPQGVAVDTTQNPPILYVSDTGNNRVLAFKNALSFSNGQKADAVIGQIDFLSVSPQGPGTGRNTGLAAPTGIAVDGSGNLYVVDSGNNRIVRFPKPLNQANQFPDLVIGQTSLNTNNPNAGGISASTLQLNTGSGAFQAYITFDASGNLWVADTGNNRVLGYRAGDLTANPPVSGPSAFVVLGQLDFASSGFNSAQPSTSLNGINAPTGLTFDQGGNLYVSESPSNARSRVLVYTPPFISGKPATRLIGVVPSNVVPQPLPVSEQQFAQSVGGLFLLNNGVGVVDSANNRLLVFNPLSQFTSNTLTQQAQLVFGQSSNFSIGRANQGRAEPGPDTLAFPTAVAVIGTEIFVVDAGNNRVLAIPYSANAIGTAVGVLGQDAFNFYAPNLVEGREFRFVGSSFDAGIAADLTSSTPHLYVADTYNNRVLGFRDLRTLMAGAKADLVIGQPDFQHVEVNYPFNDSTKPTASSLHNPVGLAVDPAGNLYVADTGNGRVLRFPTPFSSGANFPSADLVLGQPSFTVSPIHVASAVTMSAPYGLAFATNNGLLVSDVNLNRVLLFQGTSATFTSGMAATLVFGQPDFTSAAASTSGELNRFNGPHHIATDVDDRLYVADSGNGRVLIFDRAPASGPDQRAATQIPNLNGPVGIYVDPKTEAIWVAVENGNVVQQYSNFTTLLVSPTTNGTYTPIASIPDGRPLAITLDAFGDLLTADGSNRVQINFPGLTTLNAANFVANQPLAPGAIASIFGFPNQFGSLTQAASAPLPTQLANVEVLFNGKPAPLYYVGPSQINFVVPMNAPTSGTADLLVMRTDTGQVLGNFPVAMNVASPAIFTIGTVPGSGQVAAINQDGTVNGPTHPAPNLTVVAFFGTGEGFVPNAPPDGVAATGPVPAPQHINVIIGATGGFVPDANVLYSGLAPGLVGVWQVNVLIPNNVPPTTATGNTVVVFDVNSIASNGIPPNRIVTTMWVSAPK